MAIEVSFLKTRFNRMPQDEATRFMLAQILERQISRIFFANAHTMVTASRNTALKRALERSNLLLADGSGVLWGSRLMGKPLTYNLNGTDLVPALCRAGASEGLSIYLLGAKPGVAEKAAHHLLSAYPGLSIVGIHNGYFNPGETESLLESIRAANPHLLLVAMGVPTQELWIDKYSSQLPGIACMGVGGLFDFLSNRVPRAPYWVRSLGMEWVWRLAIEPSRLWRRYLIGNLIFLNLLVAHAMTEDQDFSSGSSIFKRP